MTPRKPDNKNPRRAKASKQSHRIPGDPRSRPPPFNRSDLFILIGVILLALVIRSIYLLQMQNSPLFDHPILDADFHDKWATAIAEGRSFVEGPYFRAPLYPWFLGAIYMILGRDFLIVRFIQVLIGALSCGLLYLVGREAFGRLTGAIAGALAATYWVFCYFDSELLIVSLIVFLDLLLLWCLMRIYHHSTQSGWLLAGVVLGLSAISRPNILIFIPVVLLWMYLIRRPRFTISAAVFLCGIVIPILPVTARNWTVGQDLVLISSQGGVNFYIGNNPSSDGTTAVVPGTPTDWWGGYYGAIAVAEKAVGRELSPSGVSRYYFREGLRFWADHPAAALKLLIYKAQLFWAPHEISNNKSPRFFTRNYAPIVRFLPLSFSLIAVLGLAGMIITRGDSLRLLPLWGFIIIYMCGVVAFFVNARYRVPVIPVLMLFGVEGVVRLGGWIRKRKWHESAGTVLTIVAVGVVLSLSTASLPDRTEVENANSYVKLAATLREAGRTDEAIDFYRQWIASHLKVIDTKRMNAKRLADSGHRQEALSEVQKLQEFDPVSRISVSKFCYLLLASGRDAEAIEVLRKLCMRHPGDIDLATKLASLLSTCPSNELRNGEEALRLCQPVLSMEHPSPYFLDVLAAVYAELGCFDQASEAASRALQAARASGQDQLARNIEQHRALYKDHRPVRYSFGP